MLAPLITYGKIAVSISVKVSAFQMYKPIGWVFGFQIHFRRAWDTSQNEGVTVGYQCLRFSPVDVHGQCLRFPMLFVV